MIVFDTETTGLLAHPSTPLAQQPEIIEFAAVQLDDHSLLELASFSVLIKPKQLPLPEKITEITGLRSEDLENERSFARVLPDITDFFLGERTVVAHNAPFDIGMLIVELRRVDRVHKFPWPSSHICTVETNRDLGISLKLANLYKHVTGKEPGNCHRALDDVRSTAEIVRWMKAHDRL
jgi:DNA polymerase-3 subunit alpha (Gram-positive type)